MTHETTAKKSLRKWFTVAYHKFPTCTRKNTLASPDYAFVFIFNKHVKLFSIHEIISSFKLYNRNK